MTTALAVRLLLCIVVLLALCAPVPAQEGALDCAALRAQLKVAGTEDVLAAIYARMDSLRAQIAAIYGVDGDLYEQRMKEVPLENELLRLLNDSSDLGIRGVSDAWLASLSCEEVQALTGALGRAAPTAAQPPPQPTWLSGVFSSLDGLTEAVRGGKARSVRQTFRDLTDKVKTGLDLGLSRLEDMASAIEGPLGKLLGIADKAENAGALYSFLTNPQSPEATENLLSQFGTEALTGGRSLEGLGAGVMGATFLEADIKLIGSYPGFLKGAIETVTQVIEDPTNARMYQEKYFAYVRSKMVSALSLGFYNPTPESLLAAGEKPQSVDDLAGSSGWSAGLGSYVGNSLSPGQELAISGDPSEAPALQAPEDVSLDPPETAAPRVVNLGDENGPTAQVLDLDGDGRTDRIYADLNRDGSHDWVEFEDEGGSPFLRAVDGDGDGRPEIVMQREGSADRFTHLFLDDDGDGDFDTILAGEPAGPGFGQAAYDINRDGRADRLWVDYPDQGMSVDLLDTDGNGSYDCEVTTGTTPGQAEAPRWSRCALDADGSGYAERVYVGPADNPWQIQYLDLQETGRFTGMAVDWQPQQQAYRSLYVDRDADGMFDTCYTDSDGDSIFDRQQAVRSPVMVPLAEVGREELALAPHPREAAAGGALPPPDWSFTPDPRVTRRVTLATGPVTLATTMPGWKLPQADGHFGGDLSAGQREAIEYVLSVAFAIQADLSMDAWDRSAGDRIVVLRQTQLQGCCSNWWTAPMSFSCHPQYFQGEVDFSSLFHEMGHSFTLNFPDRFRIGGKTDGPTNGILSEFLANVFQYATVHEILADANHYGLSPYLAALVRRSGEGTLQVAGAGYQTLSRDPRAYTTYDAPETPTDEGMNTFLAAAFVFEQHANQRGEYRHTVRRLMTLLRHIQPEDIAPFKDPPNEPFRASLMAAMQSYAHQSDLREELRRLGFPVDDALYDQFMARVAPAPEHAQPAASGRPLLYALGARIDKRKQEDGTPFRVTETALFAIPAEGTPGMVMELPMRQVAALCLAEGLLSPSRRQIAYFDASGEKLFVRDLSGGAPRLVCTFENPLGGYYVAPAAWSAAEDELAVRLGRFHRVVALTDGSYREAKAPGGDDQWWFVKSLVPPTSSGRWRAIATRDPHLEEMAADQWTIWDLGASSLGPVHSLAGNCDKSSFAFDRDTEEVALFECVGTRDGTPGARIVGTAFGQGGTSRPLVDLTLDWQRDAVDELGADASLLDLYSVGMSGWSRGQQWIAWATLAAGWPDGAQDYNASTKLTSMILAAPDGAAAADRRPRTIGSGMFFTWLPDGRIAYVKRPGLTGPSDALDALAIVLASPEPGAKQQVIWEGDLPGGYTPTHLFSAEPLRGESGGTIAGESGK